MINVALQLQFQLLTGVIMSGEVKALKGRSAFSCNERDESSQNVDILIIKTNEVSADM